jgi:peptidoglycan hydrolase-like protein with peptidoglycan-binding domain
MKRFFLAAAVLCFSSIVFAQANPAPDKPTGTKVVGHDRDVIVAPQKKPVQVNSGTIRAAQTELERRGYDAGPADGVAGPKTTAAISKFQADEGIAQSGRLDADTLSHLNVGGTQIVKSAPADLGRGGKAAAHNMKEGHPVAAGKAVAQGSESFGKKVGKGAKSLAVGTAEKVGKGVSSIGNKITNKTTGTDDDADKQKTDPNAAPQR